MLNVAELKKKLQDEGFVHIYEWRDEAGVEYRNHAHKGAVVLYIVDGGLTFNFEGEEVTLSAGERFDVPVGKNHTAKVGEQGCSFLVGEMIEGDS